MAPFYFEGMRMTLKAVLFDMDGTLVDSESVHFTIWNDLLAPFGVQYDEATFSLYLSIKICLSLKKQ